MQHPGLVARAAEALQQGGWSGPPVLVAVRGHLTLDLERAILEAAGLAGSFRLRVLSPARLARAVLAMAGEPVPDVLSRAEFRAYVRALSSASFSEQVAAYGAAAHGLLGALADDLLRVLELGDGRPTLSGHGPLGELSERLLGQVQAGSAAVPEPELLRRAARAAAAGLGAATLLWAVDDPPPVFRALIAALSDAGLAVEACPAEEIWPGPPPGGQEALPRREGVEVRTLAAESVQAEAAAVARRCRDLLAAGARPQDIAIGVADEQLMAPIARALREAGLPHPTEPPAAEGFRGAMGGLLTLALGGDPRSALESIVGSGVLPRAEDVRDRVLEDLRGAPATRPLAPGGPAAGMNARLRTALGGWPLFATLSGHLAHLLQCAGDLGLDAALEERGAADADAYRAFVDRVLRLGAALEGLRIAQADALRLMRDLLPQGPQGRAIPPLGAVRLGTLEQLRGAGLPHVLLAGLDEAHFPGGAQGGVLPEAVWQGTWHDSAEANARRMRGAGLTLLAAHRTLQLSYAQRSAAQDSQFPTEGLWAEGVWPPLPRSPGTGPEALLAEALSSRELARHLAVRLSRLRDLGQDPAPYLPLMAALRAAGYALPLAGLRPRTPEPRVDFGWGEAVRLSVTELERRAQCPFRWFAESRLGLGSEDDPDSFDPRGQGKLVHDILAALPEPEMTAEERTRWAEEMIESLVKSGDYPTLAGEGAARTMRHHLAQEVLRILEMVLEEQRQSGFRPIAREHRIAIAVAAEGRKVEVRGRIDRVDRSPGGFLRVLDYKVKASHKFGPDRLAGGVDLQVTTYGAWLRRSGGDLTGGGGRIGVLAYWPVRPARRSSDGPPPGEAAELWRERRPVGLFLAEPELVRELGDGPFNPLRLKQDGGVAKARAAYPQDALEAELMRAEELLAEQVRAALRGDVAPVPYRLRRETACDHCELRALCGFLPEAGDRYRPIGPA